MVRIILIKDGKRMMEDPVPKGSSVMRRRSNMVFNARLLEIMDAFEEGRLPDRSDFTPPWEDG